MADPFVGEIRIVTFNFPPRGWATCDGQILPISQNTALFSLLGTYYGGNGQSNFALPNLQGSIPIDFGNGVGLTPRDLGESGGEVNTTLDTNTLAAHSHLLAGDSDAGSSQNPTGNLVAVPAAGPRKPNQLYAAPPVNTAMQAGNVLGNGGAQPHNNLQPFLVLNYIIALQGIFPARP